MLAKGGVHDVFRDVTAGERPDAPVEHLRLCSRQRVAAQVVFETLKLVRHAQNKPNISISSRYVRLCAGGGGEGRGDGVLACLRAVSTILITHPPGWADPPFIVVTEAKLTAHGQTPPFFLYFF